MKIILFVLLVGQLILKPLYAEDQPKLQSVTAIANSELSQALQNAPWKKPRKNTPAEETFDHLSEGILLPVERDDFVRRLKYVQE